MEPRQDDTDRSARADHVLRGDSRNVSQYALVILLATTVVTCCHVLLTSYREMGAQARSFLFLYYQPVVTPIFMLWCWAMNVRYFDRNGVRYQICFASEHQRFLLDSSKLFSLATALTLLLLVNAASFAYLCSYTVYEQAAYLPPALYVSLLVVLLLPLDVLNRDARFFFVRTLWRVVAPMQAVAFTDFILADILTSLSRPLADMEAAVCTMLRQRGSTLGPLVVPDAAAVPAEVCGALSWRQPLMLSLPYIWRFIQCLIVYRTEGDFGQVLNAIKYSTAFPAIFFAAALSRAAGTAGAAAWGTAGGLLQLWLAAALLNTSYSYFWDIERDWDIPLFTTLLSGKRTPQLPLKSELLYWQLLEFYYWVVASNLVLRLSWMSRLAPAVRDSQAAALALALLEAFRRFQWVFIRIETELRKIQTRNPELGKLLERQKEKRSSPDLYEQYGVHASPKKPLAG